jgi:anti-sigma-K factor RskA
MTEEHPVDDLAAYALGSLDETERLRVDTHIAVCAACAARLRAYQGVVGALPLGLGPAPAPPGGWDAIRAAVRGRPTRRRRWAAGIRSQNWVRIARWPAVAGALVVLLIWNVTLQRELVRRAPGPAPGPEVEALSRRPGRIVILTGSGQPGASARIFVAVDGGGHLAVSGLMPLPRKRTYQLWFMRTGSPAVSGATFAVDPHGRAWVKVAVPASLDDVHAVAITEEPVTGGSSPTGKHLLDSLPWR